MRAVNFQENDNDSEEEVPRSVIDGKESELARRKIARIPSILSKVI